MGDLANREMLLARWDEVQGDPCLRDLPFRIELNSDGLIEMSRINPQHGMLLADFACLLKARLLSGAAIVACQVLTRIGLRVPDVCWASDSFLAGHDAEEVFSRAPEICIEVLSRWNSRREIEEKKQAYLAGGAIEVWIVSQDGARQVFTAAGEQPDSQFAPAAG